MTRDITVETPDTPPTPYSTIWKAPTTLRLKLGTALLMVVVRPLVDVVARLTRANVTVSSYRKGS